MQSARDGFTLIELLVVQGIIAILIGIVLPAQQEERLAHNLVAAQTTACALADAAVDFENAYGHFPGALIEAQPFCSKDAPCAAEADGYRFALNATERRAEAQPLEAGISGMESVHCLADGSVKTFTTLDALVARQLAEDQLLARGGMAAAQVMRLDEELAAAIRQGALLDVSFGADGVTIGGVVISDDVVINGPNAVADAAPALRDITDGLSNTLSLLPFIEQQAVHGLAPFSYAGLHDLTRIYSDGSATGLLAQLDAAESAALAGDVFAETAGCAAYTAGVVGEIGRSLEPNEAEVLLGLVPAVCDPGLL